MSDETRDVEALAEEVCPRGSGPCPLCLDAVRGLLASDWLAGHDARVRADALREFADAAQPLMAEAWGGSAAWFTTGEKVADVVADRLRDWAEEA